MHAQRRPLLPRNWFSLRLRQLKLHRCKRPFLSTTTLGLAPQHRMQLRASLQQCAVSRAKLHVRRARAAAVCCDARSAPKQVVQRLGGTWRRSRLLGEGIWAAQLQREGEGEPLPRR